MRNVLFGAQCNAALLAAEGASRSEVGGYLARWALLDEHQRRAAVDQLCVPGGHPYMSAYYYGWRLLEPWLTRADRHTKARRVLTEQLLPVDLVSPGG